MSILSHLVAVPQFMTSDEMARTSREVVVGTAETEAAGLIFDLRPLFPVSGKGGSNRQQPSIAAATKATRKEGGP